MSFEPCLGVYIYIEFCFYFLYALKKIVNSKFIKKNNYTILKDRKILNIPRQLTYLKTYRYTF